MVKGKKKVSKVFEYRIRSDIKKKLQIFQQLELPLLIKKGFLNELSKYTQMSANTQTDLEELSLEGIHNNNVNHLLPERNIALGEISRVIPHFWTRDLFLTKETLYQAELPRHKRLMYNRFSKSEVSGDNINEDLILSFLIKIRSLSNYLNLENSNLKVIINNSFSNVIYYRRL